MVQLSLVWFQIMHYLFSKKFVHLKNKIYNCSLFINNVTNLLRCSANESGWVQELFEFTVDRSKIGSVEYPLHHVIALAMLLDLGGRLL